MPDHTVNVDLSQATQGENTYTCIVCNQPIILVWNGYTDDDGFHATNWGLRAQDASDESLVNLNINYVS